MHVHGVISIHSSRYINCLQKEEMPVVSYLGSGANVNVGSTYMVVLSSVSCITSKEKEEL